MDIQKTEEQIRQMLRKAETTTAAEAEMIQARAEKLMLRLGIDRAMLDDSAPADKEAIEEIRITFTGSYAAGKVMAASAIANAMGSVFVMQSKMGSSRILYLVGKTSQLVDIKMMIESLELQSAVALKEWWMEQYIADKTGMQKFVMRRQFMISFGHGAGMRIKEEKRVIVEEVAGAALVLRSDALAAEAHARQQHSVGRGRTSRMSGSYDASAAGRAAGRRANVGTTQLGNQKALAS